MTDPTPDEVALLPCPFCGPGQSHVNLFFDDLSQRYKVGCGRCGASTGISCRDKTPAPAIAAWNHRDPRALSEAEAKGRREGLEEAAGVASGHEFRARMSVRSSRGPRSRAKALSHEAAAQEIKGVILALADEKEPTETNAAATQDYD